ncbi:MarR family winged helix-turn-helix transcriptional regulator [Furfurilactobacillus sp. WILCCON 0119]|uniref:MarR family winged helix-turn-helix transcriptional regulator n=1 Tax=Furfurilactobacillus entadae TaxID=2922307 RepID=UPI0035ED20DF
MTESTTPSQADIDRVTTLLIHGYLTEIYALQKITVDVADLNKLSFRDILLITQIGLEPGITSTKLSRTFRISSPLLSTRITALMHLDLVEQVEGSMDRRIHNLKLLERGEAVYQHWYARIQEMAKSLLATFPRTEIDTMEDHIGGILEIVNHDLHDEK